jgi:hypothetical protein
MASLGSSVTTEANEDGLAAALGEARKVKRWVQEIRFYESKSKQWEEKGKKILRRFKDDRSPREQKVPRFNILWSVVESARPALFGQNPKPDIERRFRDKDDLGRISSMVLERSITYFITESFGDAVRQAVTDRLLPGRGLVWARYEPHFHDKTENENEEVADEGEEITDNIEDDEGNAGKKADPHTDAGDAGGEDIENEVICWDYVHWQDFGHCFGRTWDEVPACWRKVYLTRDELKERFGEEIGGDITLDYSPHDLKDNKYDEVEKKATIYEIWDKEDKKVLWVHKDYQHGPLDEQNDPLQLEDFWPFPKPLYATLANDDMIPVPDYIEWQDQASELDEITSRIGAITRAVKVAGVYDASAPGIGRLLAEGVENQLIPVEQWAIFAEKGGLKSVMALLPMEEILQTLLGLYEAREKVKQDLYEISGSADIMRGQSDPDETATAQNIKSNFGTMRLNDKQEQVRRFCRDLVKIGTEIIANHFSIETIKKICGVQLLTEAEKQLVQFRMKTLQQFAQMQKQQPQQHGMPPAQPPQLPPLPDWLQKCDQEDMDELMENPTWEEIEKLLRDEITLSYKIDIETDSTLKVDQEADKAARVEFLEAAGKFIQAAQSVQNPDLAPLLGKMLEFGIRGFKVGKELETAFEVAIHKLEKDADGPPKPNPEMMKIQGEQQLGQARLQADLAIEKQKSDDEQKRLTMQAQVDANQGKVDAEVEKFKIQLQGQLDMAKAKLESETKIIVAKISAGAKAVAEGGNDPSIPASTGDILGPNLNDLMTTVISELRNTLQGIQQSHQGMMNAHQNLTQAIARPKQIMRDENGNIVGVH